jgi:hypothetical protein
MTRNLQRDLDASLADGELLARNQISGALNYLVQGQNFTTFEVRSILDEILTNLECASDLRMRTGIWVN